MIYKKCWYCGEKIKADTFATHQKFCSPKCQKEFSKLPLSERKRIEKENFIPIEFECSQCGNVVSIEDPGDKRTRFCCKECEKKYWRHPPYEQETSRTNFHSLQEYLSWEKRTNL